jgi:hypothetical protein
MKGDGEDRCTQAPHHPHFSDKLSWQSLGGLQIRLSRSHVTPLQTNHFYQDHAPITGWTALEFPGAG